MTHHSRRHYLFLRYNACGLSDDVFCSLFLFFFKTFCLLLLSQNQSSFSLSKKNYLFRPQNTNLLFFSLSRTDYNTERESFVISCLIKHDVIHIHFDMSSTPNVPSPPPSDPFAPNPPPVPGILITKVRFLNRFLKREKERETNNRNVLLREDHLSSAG